MRDREHIVTIEHRQIEPLRTWLAQPNGAFTAGDRVTFEAVEGGRAWVRTKPAAEGVPTTEVEDAFTVLTALRGPLARIAIHLGLEASVITEAPSLAAAADGLAKATAAMVLELEDANKQLNEREEVLSSLRYEIRTSAGLGNGTRTRLLNILDGADGTYGFSAAGTSLTEVDPDPERANAPHPDDLGADGYPKADVSGVPWKEPGCQVLCSCGGTIRPVEDHVVDHTRPVPPEHPALQVQFADGRMGYYDALDGWKIRDSQIILGRRALTIPTASNVMHVSIRRGQR